MHKRHAVFLAFFLLCSPGKGEAICKDPMSPADPLLDPLAKPLDELGIDYRRRWSGLVQPDAQRPQLARLGGYPVESKSFLHRSWQAGFEKALYSNGSLMAIPRTATAEASAGSFVEEWHRTPVSRRVFISFTRADIAYATQVRTLLQSQGYTVFTYLGKGPAPELTSEAVGKLFRTAGHHLVIDTPNARTSFGVILEAHSVRAVEARARIAAAEALARKEALARQEAQARKDAQVRKDAASRIATLDEASSSSTAPQSELQGCVECYCGPRYLGCVSPAACIEGTPCG